MEKQKSDIGRPDQKQDHPVQDETIAAIRKLASEIAHDVNNSLMIILGNAQLSLMEGAKEEDMKNSLKNIFEECQRAKSIIQRQLKFSRPGKGEIKEEE